MSAIFVSQKVIFTSGQNVKPLSLSFGTMRKPKNQNLNQIVYMTVCGNVY